MQLTYGSTSACCAVPLARHLLLCCVVKNINHKVANACISLYELL
uniref:Uncharacterized protein n=1 Tax=Arundo donax TaxID=35708 RepID=A0A0A8YZ99_ARUDO